MKKNGWKTIIFVSSVIFGACNDELDGFNWGGGWFDHGGGPAFDQIDDILPWLFFDSATNITDSTLTMWVHVEYNSTIVFESCDVEFQYLGTPPQTFYKKFPLVDTVDFKILTAAYSFKLDMDSLAANSEYIFSGGIYYYGKDDFVIRQPSGNNILVRTGF